MCVAFLAVRELSGIWHKANSHIVAPRLKAQQEEQQWPSELAPAKPPEQEAAQSANVAPLTLPIKSAK